MLVSLCFAAMGGAAVLVLQGAGRRQAAALGPAACWAWPAGWAGWRPGRYAFGYYGRNRMAEGRELISGKDNSNLEYLPAQFEEAWVEDTNIHPVDGAVLLDSTRQDKHLHRHRRRQRRRRQQPGTAADRLPGYRITANDGGTLSLGATATGKGGRGAGRRLQRHLYGQLGRTAELAGRRAGQPGHRGRAGRVRPAPPGPLPETEQDPRAARSPGVLYAARVRGRRTVDFLFANGL